MRYHPLSRSICRGICKKDIILVNVKVEQNKKLADLRMVYDIRFKLWNGRWFQKVGVDPLPESAMKKKAAMLIRFEVSPKISVRQREFSPFAIRAFLS